MPAARTMYILSHIFLAVFSALAADDVPQIAFDSNWGTIKQNGRSITISGHDQWIATGEIRADGKLKLLWIHNDTGRPAPALYTIKRGAIEGEWGWHERAHWLDNGDLFGDLMPDRIFKITSP